MRVRVLYWRGELPKAGDALLTSTGSAYLITKVCPRSLLVERIHPLAGLSGVQGTVFKWEWGRRGTKRRTKAVNLTARKEQ